MNDGLRADAIFNRLALIRDHCHHNPSINVSINLNGMNGSVDVKVFEDNACVLALLDPDDSLVEMLGEVVSYLHIGAQAEPNNPITKNLPAVPGTQNPQNVSWGDYSTCSRCHAVMGEPCRRIDDMSLVRQTPHVGRMRFQGRGIRTTTFRGLSPL